MRMGGGGYPNRNHSRLKRSSEYILQTEMIFLRLATVSDDCAHPANQPAVIIDSIRVCFSTGRFLYGSFVLNVIILEEKRYV